MGSEMCIRDSSLLRAFQKTQNEKQSVETGCAPRCMAAREAAAAAQQQHSSSTAAAQQQTLSTPTDGSFLARDTSTHTKLSSLPSLVLNLHDFGQLSNRSRLFFTYVVPTVLDVRSAHRAGLGTFSQFRPFNSFPFLPTCIFLVVDSVSKSCLSSTRPEPAAAPLPSTQKRTRKN